MPKLSDTYLALFIIFITSIIAIFVVPIYMIFVPFIWLFKNKISDKNLDRLFFILSLLVYNDDF